MIRGEIRMSNQFEEQKWRNFIKRVPEDFIDQALSLEYAVETRDNDYVRSTFIETIGKIQYINSRIEKYQKHYNERNNDELNEERKEVKQLRNRVGELTQERNDLIDMLKQQKEQMEQMIQEREQLLNTIEQLKKQNIIGKLKKDIDLEELNKFYQLTKSYRATGERFGLSGHTVEKYLRIGGYIG